MIKLWKVERSESLPEGIKYSLAYIDSRGRRILGYDVHHGKSHHRHLEDSESPYRFESLEALLRDFEEDVRRLRGER